MTTTMLARILLADDGSEAAIPARTAAVRLAAMSHAKLSIVYVLEPFQDEEDGRKVLHEAVQMAEEHDVAHDILFESPIGITNPGRRVLHAAEECGADLVVIGARGLGGVGRLLLGSVSTYVVHHADRSVFVAR